MVDLKLYFEIALDNVILTTGPFLTSVAEGEFDWIQY